MRLSCSQEDWRDSRWASPLEMRSRALTSSASTVAIFLSRSLARAMCSWALAFQSSRLGTKAPFSASEARWLSSLRVRSKSAALRASAEASSAAALRRSNSWVREKSSSALRRHSLRAVERVIPLRVQAASFSRAAVGTVLGLRYLDVGGLRPLPGGPGTLRRAPRAGTCRIRRSGSAAPRESSSLRRTPPFPELGVVRCLSRGLCGAGRVRPPPPATAAGVLGRLDSQALIIPARGPRAWPRILFRASPAYAGGIPEVGGLHRARRAFGVGCPARRRETNSSSF